jgi:hypothetical protein
VLDARARRIADNESRFREINERLEADLRRLPSEDGPVEFVCECGRTECAASVQLTIDEYEQVRKDSTTFAMLPGHDIEDVEDVVFSNERYAVARKKPPAWPVVEARDPRTGDDG